MQRVGIDLNNGVVCKPNTTTLFDGTRVVEWYCPQCQKVVRKFIIRANGEFENHPIVKDAPHTHSSGGAVIMYDNPIKGGAHVY